MVVWFFENWRLFSKHENFIPENGVWFMKMIKDKLPVKKTTDF